MEVGPELLRDATATMQRINQATERLRTETAGKVQGWREHFALIKETLDDCAVIINAIRAHLPDEIVVSSLSAEQMRDVTILQRFHIHEHGILESFRSSTKEVLQEIEHLLEIHHLYLEPFRRAEDRLGGDAEWVRQMTWIIHQSQCEVEEFYDSLIRQGRGMFMG